MEENLFKKTESQLYRYYEYKSKIQKFRRKVDDLEDQIISLDNQMRNVHFFSTLFGALIGGGITVFWGYKANMKEAKIKKQTQVLEELIKLISKMEFNNKSFEDQYGWITSGDLEIEEKDREEYKFSEKEYEKDWKVFSLRFIEFSELYSYMFISDIQDKIREVYKLIDLEALRISAVIKMLPGDDDDDDKEPVLKRIKKLDDLRKSLVNKDLNEIFM